MSSWKKIWCGLKFCRNWRMTSRTTTTMRYGFHWNASTGAWKNLTYTWNSFLPQSPWALAAACVHRGRQKARRPLIWKCEFEPWTRLRGLFFINRAAAVVYSKIGWWSSVDPSGSRQQFDQIWKRVRSCNQRTMTNGKGERSNEAAKPRKGRGRHEHVIAKPR